MMYFQVFSDGKTDMVGTNFLERVEFQALVHEAQIQAFTVVLVRPQTLFFLGNNSIEKELRSICSDLLRTAFF